MRRIQREINECHLRSTYPSENIYDFLFGFLFTCIRKRHCVKWILVEIIWRYCASFVTLHTIFLFVAHTRKSIYKQNDNNVFHPANTYSDDLCFGNVFVRRKFEEIRIKSLNLDRLIFTSEKNCFTLAKQNSFSLFFFLFVIIFIFAVST